MVFTDRIEAAELLSDKLQQYADGDGVLLAIPRGGVPLGYVLSKNLNLPLDLVLSKKIGHPNNPEYAIGSVTEDTQILNEHYAAIYQEYIGNETDRLRAELKKKRLDLIGHAALPSVKNKIVIIVDDGVATGSTILASIASLRKQSPSKIVVAVPVSPLDAAKELSQAADEFICLYQPSHFRGVGQFYQHFDQVSDERVKEFMEEIQRGKK